MKKNVKSLLLAMLVLPLCANFACAQGAQSPQQSVTPAQSVSAVNLNLIEDTNNDEPDITDDAVVPVSNPTPPKLVAPVVEDPKLKKPAASKKIDLKAVLFDSDATFDSQALAEGREMTKLEEAQYNVHEALHGEVQAISATPLMNDKWKMKFDKGPIESITPWVDYSATMGNFYAGEDLKNTLYRTRFQDIGLNGKFRNGKTVFRLMANTGMEVPGNSYFQSFFFDNYIMHSLTKTDQVLAGYARTAIGIEGAQSPYTIPFMGRSQIANAYGNVRALGTKFQGNHELYDYSVGFFSSGRWFHDVFAGPEFVGQFAVKPLGKTKGKYGTLMLGGGLNSGKVDQVYNVGTAYIDYEYKRLKATIEYGSADGSNGAAGLTKNQSEGYNGTLAYRVTPKLQALVRYDVFDPNKNKENDMRRECTAGLNYFVKGQAIKLMFNYTMYSVENGTYGSRVLLGSQFVL